MRISVIERNKQPLRYLTLQIKTKNGESFSVTTDQDGRIELDEKFKGQQIAATANGTQGGWITATDGLTLTLETKQKEGRGEREGGVSGDREREREREERGERERGTSGSGMGGGNKEKEKTWK